MCSEVSSQKRVLITGISGFTGAHLRRRLSCKGYEVWGTTRNPSTDSKIVQVDLLEDEKLAQFVLLARPRVVVHLAGISFAGGDRDRELYCTNIIGTRNLMMAVDKLREPPELVLNASTSHVYGDSSIAIDENSNINPSSDYAISKLSAEYVVALWSDRQNIVTVRPFNCIGVGQSQQFFVPKVVLHHVRRAKTLQLGNIQVARDFLDIRTLVEYYVRMIEVVPTGGIFNVCSGVPVSLTDIVDKVSELTGHRLDVTMDARLQRKSDSVVRFGDNSRLEKLVGGVENYVMEETLRWIIDSCQ